MITYQIGNKTLVVPDLTAEKMIEMAMRAAKCDLPVLISGPSGSGKEVLSRFIHEKSRRREHRFISINCAAIPEGLLESELFGFEKGAFTGAIQNRMGKFEQAHEGTLLLDEITEMPLHLQAKLLRVLQEKEVDKLGGNRAVLVDFRVIATTNRTILTQVKEGKFREDLYYRLNGIPIQVFPLQQRLEAIRALCTYFLSQVCIRYQLQEVRFTESAWAKLLSYHWPGNIREVQNTVERAVFLSGTETIQVEHITGCENSVGDMGSLESMEKTKILETLAATHGNQEEAARLLGITSRTIRNKLRQYRENS